MNKIFKNKIITFLCIASLFLTGCRKKQKIENNDQVICEKAQIETFEEGENSLNRESIFADEDEHCNVRWYASTKVSWEQAR